VAERNARADDDDARSGLPDITKKILSLGLGAYFLTEDAIRRAVKEAKIPREIGKSIAQNASKGKEELFGFVARELSSFLRQMDVQQELDRFARTHKIRATVEIEFLPREGVVVEKRPASGEGFVDEPAEEDAEDPGSALGRAIELDLKIAEPRGSSPKPPSGVGRVPDEEDEPE
jgi:hypothetical protein